jgi:hypothetical protein
MELMSLNSKPSIEDAEEASEDPGLHLSWLNSWPRLYAIVFGELGLLILLFYLFTKSFE